MASFRDTESRAVASPEPASSDFTGVIDGTLQRRTLLKMMAAGAGCSKAS